MFTETLDFHASHPRDRIPTIIELHSRTSSEKGSVKSTDEPALVYFEGHIHTTSGLLEVPPGHFSSMTTRNLTLASARAGVGAYISIHHDVSTGTYFVNNDYHGFQPIFYLGQSRQSRQSLTLSDTFSGALLALKEEGRSPTLNPSVILPQFASFNALLNHTWFTTETSVKNISLLRPDTELQLRAGILSVNSLAHFRDPSNRSYDQLLDEGISRAVEQLRALSALPVGDKMLYLSGGRDSRALLALMGAAGVARHFTAHAKPAPSHTAGTAAAKQFQTKLSNDRSIAATLAQRYGMQPWNDPHVVEVNPGLKNRDWWLSHWAGIMTDYFTPRQVALRPSLRLFGGMGENFRSKVPDYMSSIRPPLELAMTPSSFEADFVTYYDRICPPLASYDTSNWAAGRDLFKQSLAYTTAPSALWEGIDRFSEIYRQSAHFGHLNSDRSENIFSFAPLAQPEFTMATSTLDRDSRTSGRVLFDIIDRLDPTLNTIPFEGSRWTDSLFAGRPHYRTLPSQPDHGFSEGFWAESDRTRQGNLRRNQLIVGSTAPTIPDEPDSARTLALLDQLRGDLEPIVGAPRYRALADMVKDKRLLVARLRGRLETFHHVVHHPTTPSAIRVRVA